MAFEILYAVVKQSVIVSSNITPILFIFNPDITGDVIYRTIENLNPSHLVNTLLNPFKVFFDWVIYNLITPLLLIAFTILFFVGQYYLIKLYYFFMKTVFVNGYNLYNIAVDLNNKKQYVNKIINTFSK